MTTGLLNYWNQEDENMKHKGYLVCLKDKEREGKGLEMRQTREKMEMRALSMGDIEV